MTILWDEGTDLTGDNIVDLVGSYVRIEVTSYPSWIGIPPGLLPWIRGLGRVGFLIDGAGDTDEALGYLDTIIGAAAIEANQVHIFLYAGVEATVYQGAAMSAVTQPSSLVEATAVQTIPDSAITFITWGQQTAGLGQLWNIASPTRWTVRESGLYLAEVQVLMTTATYTTMILNLYKNGVNVRRLTRQANAAPAVAGNLVYGSGMIDVVENDYLEVQIYQTSGAGRDTILPTRGQLARLTSI